MSDLPDELELTNTPKRAIAIGVVVIALIIAGVFTLGASISTGYTLDEASSDGITLANTRLAIHKSALDGSGAINAKECDTLGEIAKKTDSNAQWFADCGYSLYGSTQDTDTVNVIKLSDGNYCATFTLDKEFTKVTNYTFVNSKCGDSRIAITR